MILSLSIFYCSHFLPPLSVQNKIADEVKRRMQKADSLQKESKEELEKAKQGVERIIFLR